MNGGIQLFSFFFFLNTADNFRSIPASIYLVFVDNLIK